jgi:Pyridoxamine 5'-phosphate oxidase
MARETRRLVTWPDLEAEAPELARRGRERLEETSIALIGTLRKDGSPRISPIEPYFLEDELLFGGMTWSLKVRDLQRDPRCVVHSAITGPSAGEPELRLYGRAETADERLRRECPGWWADQPAEAAWVFTIRLEAATLLEWDYAAGEMLVRRWSPERGSRESRRSYP